jgi:signal transduction histidine kinase
LQNYYTQILYIRKHLLQYRILRWVEELFKSFINKFVFFFWSFFFVVTIPIFFFITFQFKDIIKTSEEQKVNIIFNSLKPTISIHMFLDQDKQLKELLDNMFKNKDVKSVKLISKDNIELYVKKQDNTKGTTQIYSSEVLDLLNHEKIATLYLEYSNQSLNKFNEKILVVLIVTLIFSVVVFLFVFFHIRDDLITLRSIAISLTKYASTKKIEPIAQTSKSIEISTIANIANEMLINIADYVKQLKSFNTELEKRVKEEVDKQQNQEKLMIHQSRQAAMGEMLESIAHQWRQPLNIIGLATVNLETQVAFGNINNDEFSDKIGIITKNIQYMSDTIDDFRDFLNPQKAMIAFEPKKSIEDVLNILNAQLKNYKIDTTINSSCNTNIYGVENEFKQVIIIILNNSKDAIKQKQIRDKSVDGKVYIKIDCQNGYLTIKICDNGGGISDDVITHVFDPYFSTKQNANGTGIGLYIAKNIIESRMKGNISVKNTNEGCCFSISLPIREDN